MSSVVMILWCFFASVFYLADLQEKIKDRRVGRSLLHHRQDATKLSRKGALLRMSQLCEFMILRVQLKAKDPALHHIWTLEKIITCEICSYDPCDRDRRIPIDVS